MTQDGPQQADPSAVERVAAGKLTSSHIGRCALLPAVWRDGGWQRGWRRISMITHTTKGVKVRCANSAHVDHSLAPGDLVEITTGPHDPASEVHG